MFQVDNEDTYLTPMAPMNVLFTFNLGRLSPEYVNKLRI